MKNLILKFIYWVLAGYARKVIRHHKPFVIGVTGSVGKTSTKEAVFQVLSDHFGAKVRRSFGNLNAEIGIPLTILGYEKLPSKIFWPVFLLKAYTRTFQKSYPKYLVLEMGVEHKGDFAYFGSITKLDVAVITSTEGAHLANFRDIDEYRIEKISIVKLLKDDGTLIINRADESSAKIEHDKKVTFAVNDNKADHFAENIKLTLSGSEYRICSVGQKIAIRSGLLGEQYIAANLAAFAVGSLFNIQSLEIKKSLEKIQPIAGRMRLIEGKKNCTLIDDTYNASPASVAAALETLAGMKYTGRKVAILGNMNELGRTEISEHAKIGKFSQDRADLVIFVGKNAEVMADAHGKKDLAMIFPNRTELIKGLDLIIQPRDLVLIKASQNGNYFEEVTKKLMKEPDRAPDLLVRQSRAWLRKK